MPWRWERWTGAPNADQATALQRLVGDVTRHDGIAPLSDAMVLAPPPDAHSVMAYTAPNEPVGYGITDPTTALAEFLVLPGARKHGLGAALAAATADAGARLWWAHGNLPGAQALANHHALAVNRELLLLKRSGSPPDAELPPGFHIRRYRPDGSDDAAILAVNAAAFADLPDQGGWGPADLQARTAAPWFAPDDLLLLVTPTSGPTQTELPDGQLAGFHWTKRHPTGECEVYVIAVAPQWQGQGLATPLLSAGLSHLAVCGCVEAGLYVDAVNEVALRIYHRRGFQLARTDVLYSWP